jgi:hypothetical protein
MALHKNNYNLQRFLPPPPPQIEPLILTGEEKYLASAGNPTPAVQPVARRDAMDIYFSLDLSSFASFMRDCS